MKTLVKTVGFVALATFFACSNNTVNNNNNSTGDQATTVSAEGLVLNGVSDSAKVEILLADNYLKKVLKGDPYASTPSLTPNPAAFLQIKTQVKITDFSYFSKSVDITCDKDTPVNTLDVMLLGSNQLGHYVWFLPNSSDGLFYAYDLTTLATPAAQGPEDEIEEGVVFNVGVTDTVYTFLCDGSDGNTYDVSFHGKYDPNNMQISSIFDFKTNEFTGAISVSLHNYDLPIDMFFNKQ